MPIITYTDIILFPKKYIGLDACKKTIWILYEGMLLRYNLYISIFVIGEFEYDTLLL